MSEPLIVMVVGVHSRLPVQEGPCWGVYAIDTEDESLAIKRAKQEFRKEFAGAIPLKAKIEKDEYKD